MDIMTTYPVNSGQRFRLDIFGMDGSAHCDQFEYRLSVDEGDNDGEVIGGQDGYYGSDVLGGEIMLHVTDDIENYIKREGDKWRLAQEIIAKKAKKVEKFIEYLEYRWLSVAYSYANNNIISLNLNSSDMGLLRELGLSNRAESARMIDESVSYLINKYKK